MMCHVLSISYPQKILMAFQLRFLWNIVLVTEMYRHEFEVLTRCETMADCCPWHNPREDGRIGMGSARVAKRFVLF